MYCLQAPCFISNVHLRKKAKHEGPGNCGGMEQISLSLNSLRSVWFHLWKTFIILISFEFLIGKIDLLGTAVAKVAIATMRMYLCIVGRNLKGTWCADIRKCWPVLVRGAADAFHSTKSTFKYLSANKENQAAIYTIFFGEILARAIERQNC